MSGSPCLRTYFGVLLIICLGLVGGCKARPTGPSPELPALLTSGDQICQEMKDATLRREYAELTKSYELLRITYIDAAERVSSSPAQATSEVLATLAGWEETIANFRRFWNQIDEQNAEEAQLLDLSDKMKELLEQGKVARQQKIAEWAPVEKQLDEALQSVQKIGKLPSK